MAEGLSPAEVPRLLCSACLALYCVVPGMNFLQAQERCEQTPTSRQPMKLLSDGGLQLDALLQLLCHACHGCSLILVSMKFDQPAFNNDHQGLELM